MKKIKVLIVDDSRIFRHIVNEALSKLTNIEVIGSVRNGKKAIEFLETHTPDVVTLDVEMDEMDGLETLKEIKEINVKRNSNIGVIMLSAHTKQGADITIEALEAGAFDFLTKPAAKNANESIKVLREELSEKIDELNKRKNRVRASLSTKPIQKRTVKVEPRKKIAPSKYEAILIGVSTGGPKALAELMPKLTQNTDLPIFIVQHMPATFTKALAESLNKKSPYTVVEAKDGDIAQKETAYIAPGGKHMVLRKAGIEGLKINVNNQPPEEGCKPSVNILFRSAAPILGANVIALILTGMGSDGTRGLRSLKRNGAYIIAQDQKSSVVWGMPGSAVESGVVDDVASLNEIAELVEKKLSN